MMHPIQPTKVWIRSLIVSVAGGMLLLSACTPAAAFQERVPVRRPLYGGLYPVFPTDRPALLPPRATVLPETLETLTGEVVDTSPNRITFSNNEIYEQSFLITDETNVVLNSKPVSLTELRPGDAVKITLNRINPKVAQRIRAARIVPDPRVRAGIPPQRISRGYRPQPAADEEGGLGVVVASSPGEGVLVLRVKPRSPAELAGIQIGDYILSVAGESVSEADLLVSLVQSRAPGQSVELTLWRDGERMRRQVTLAEREQAMDATRSDARLDLIAVSSEALSRGAIIPPGDEPSRLSPQSGEQEPPRTFEQENQPPQDVERQTLLREIQALQEQLQELRQQMDGLQQSEAEGTSI